MASELVANLTGPYQTLSAWV